MATVQGSSRSWLQADPAPPKIVMGRTRLESSGSQVEVTSAGARSSLPGIPKTLKETGKYRLIGLWGFLPWPPLQSGEYGHFAAVKLRVFRRRGGMRAGAEQGLWCGGLVEPWRKLQAKQVGRVFSRGPGKSHSPGVPASRGQAPPTLTRVPSPGQWR